jgi:hypothetical protein
MGTLKDEHRGLGLPKVLKDRRYRTPRLFLATVYYDLQTPRRPTVLHSAVTNGQHDRVEI